jgi:hypothetical protein
MTASSTPLRTVPESGASDANGAGTSAMDLVCRRMPSVSDTATSNGGPRGLRPQAPWFRHPAVEAVLEPQYTVTLPNPRHPQPPPPVIRHHGVDHLLVSKCWGDAGSHTADLALNVMAAYYPHADDVPGIRMADGSTVSEAAYRLHRAFKFAYLVRMSDEGGVVSEAEIRRWLALQLGGGVKKAPDTTSTAATPSRPRAGMAPAK